MFARRVLSAISAKKVLFATTAVTTTVYLLHQTQDQPNVLLCESKKEGVFNDWQKKSIGLYENRLRQFSHPYKIFTHFATVRKDGEIFMTPRDFIRSLLPYRRTIDPQKSTRVPSAEMFFSLADTDGDGLIDYSEYLLFLTLIATPTYHWKISFKLFDIDGDGTVSKHEFQRIMNQQTSELSIGRRLGKNESQLQLHTGLSRFFFGKDGKKKVRFEEFSDFMQRLHLEVLKLEFYQFPVDKDNTISLSDFASSIITYTAPNKVENFEKRLELIAKDLDEKNERVSFKKFFDFDQMVKNRLHDIGLAYKFYSSMSNNHTGFNKMELQRVIKNLAKCELTDGQIDAIFALFDVDSDGRLNGDEFYQALKWRNQRGLGAGDKGIKAWFSKVVDCVQGN